MGCVPKLAFTDHLLKACYYVGVVISTNVVEIQCVEIVNKVKLTCAKCIQ